MELDYLGDKIYYTTAGSGPAVVFLHGFLESVEMWDETIPHFIKSNTVICIDVPGHGKSDLQNQNTPELSFFSDCVKAVLVELNIKKSSIVGHSMGGYIGLVFAKEFPEIIENLILINSTCLPDNEERYANRNRAVNVISKNFSLFVTEAIPYLFSKSSKEKHKSKIVRIKTFAHKTSVKGAIYGSLAMKKRVNMITVAEKLGDKFSILFGEEDNIIEKDQRVYHVDRLSHAYIETIPNGHMSFIEEFEKTITFLKTAMQE